MSEKVVNLKNFDQVFFPDRNWIFVRLFLYFFLPGFAILFYEGFVVTIFLLFMMYMSSYFYFSPIFPVLLSVPIVFYLFLVVLQIIYFFKYSHKAHVGINKEGVYLLGAGMIHWQDIDEILIERRMPSNYIVIFLKKPKRDIFQNKSWFQIFYLKRVGLFRIMPDGHLEISSYDVDLPLDTLLKKLESYHRKYA